VYRRLCHHVIPYTSALITGDSSGESLGSGFLLYQGSFTNGCPLQKPVGIEPTADTTTSIELSSLLVFSYKSEFVLSMHSSYTRNHSFTDRTLVVARHGEPVIESLTICRPPVWILKMRTKHADRLLPDRKGCSYCLRF
jgi:hypothetical protein